MSYRCFCHDVAFYGSLAVASFIVGRLLFRRIFKEGLVDPKGKAVLITGCDRGFGKETTLRLAADGYVVFAGCLDAVQAKSATYSKFSSSQIYVLQMDVCKPEQVNSSVQTVTSWLQKNPDYVLHGLIANAGVLNPGNVEFVSMQAIEQLINVNLLGLIRVVRSFLPVMRLRGKKTDGRIITIASMAAQVCCPGLGTYSATKAGVLAFSDSLRFEVERFGMAVSVVLPDYFATDMVSNVEQNCAMFERNLAQANREVVEAYDDYVEKTRAHFKTALPSMANQQISQVIDVIAEAVESRRPQRRYYVTKYQNISRFFIALREIIPTILDRAIKKSHNA